MPLYILYIVRVTIYINKVHQSAFITYVNESMKLVHNKDIIYGNMIYNQGHIFGSYGMGNSLWC